MDPQRRDYKNFAPNVTWDTVDWTGSRTPATSIQELPVTSAVTSPAPGATVDAAPGGTVAVRGYAWSGGGRGIVRVEVSGDGGREWVNAEIVGRGEALRPAPSAAGGGEAAGGENRTWRRQPEGREWSWTLWEARVPAPAPGAEAEIVCRATDTSQATQPERIESIWNIRGTVNNAWHRIKVQVAAARRAQ
jgi:sulfite oxidase